MDIRFVEGVQCRTTEIVCSMVNLHYEDWIKRLGFMHLDKWRVRNDFVETSKIINGSCDIHPMVSFKI